MATQKRTTTSRSNLSALLAEEPPENALKTRKEAKRTLTYIEGYYVIQTANRIFGPTGWQRMFTGRGLTLVQEAKVPVKKPTGEVYDRYDVAYICEYRVQVGDQVVEDVGYGIGQSYQGFAAAHESAVKEAVTDALKRCLRSFGNAFGNCLYDKQWLKNGEHTGGDVDSPLPPMVESPPAEAGNGSKCNSFAQTWNSLLIAELAKLGLHKVPAPVRRAICIEMANGKLCEHYIAQANANTEPNDPDRIAMPAISWGTMIGKDDPAWMVLSDVLNRYVQDGKLKGAYQRAVQAAKIHASE